MESRKHSLQKSWKFVFVNCGANNLNYDGPNEISDEPFCMELSLSERLSYLWIVISGIIPPEIKELAKEDRSR